MRSAGARAAIEAAIENRQLLTFMYHGHPRAVEPHIYGVLGSGLHALSGYQIAGTSRGGELGWKNFHLRDMSQVEPLDRHFPRPRPDYNPDDKRFRKVFKRL